jgi:hypothetical protein
MSGMVAFVGDNSSGLARGVPAGGSEIESRNGTCAGGFVGAEGRRLQVKTAWTWRGGVIQLEGIAT